MGKFTAMIILHFHTPLCLKYKCLSLVFLTKMKAGCNSKKFCRRFASSTCVVEKLQKDWSRFLSVFPLRRSIEIPLFSLSFESRVCIFRSKIQNFLQTFFQNNNFFFQTQGYQIGDQKRPYRKTREQSFFRGARQTYGRDWIRFDRNEKISLI